MFKLRTVADLTKTYIITSSKLKVAHFSIVALTIAVYCYYCQYKSSCFSSNPNILAGWLPYI